MLKTAHILLVEDDESLAFVIKDNLEKAGYQVTLATNGEEGCSVFSPSIHALCILDVMLPKLDGFACAENIRSKDNNTPILFLTAKSMKEDVLQGFKHGGDDYITKPFSFQELLYRIDVFLKRSQKELAQPELILSFRNINFNIQSLTLTINETVFGLTQKETDLLTLFFEHKNKLLKRETILNQIWGDDDYFMGRSLDVFISKLRKYLKNAEGVSILNHHGVGFKMMVED
ncbi:MAG: response regulator transcription factor [Cyclobacteriaceae bacterium]|nr:response regulator transcription factor [Cyclobacteriaceae bacterium]